MLQRLVHEKINLRGLHYKGFCVQIDKTITKICQLLCQWGLVDLSSSLIEVCQLHYHFSQKICQLSCQFQGFHHGGNEGSVHTGCLGHAKYSEKVWYYSGSGLKYHAVTARCLVR